MGIPQHPNKNPRYYRSATCITIRGLYPAYTHVLERSLGLGEPANFPKSPFAASWCPHGRLQNSHNENHQFVGPASTDWLRLSSTKSKASQSPWSKPGSPDLFPRHRLDPTIIHKAFIRLLQIPNRWVYCQRVPFYPNLVQIIWAVSTSWTEHYWKRIVPLWYLMIIWISGLTGTWPDLWRLRLPIPVINCLR